MDIWENFGRKSLPLLEFVEGLNLLQIKCASRAGNGFARAADGTPLLPRLGG